MSTTPRTAKPRRASAKVPAPAVPKSQASTARLDLMSGNRNQIAARIPITLVDGIREASTMAQARGGPPNRSEWMRKVLEDAVAVEFKAAGKPWPAPDAGRATA